MKKVVEVQHKDDNESNDNEEDKENSMMKKEKTDNSMYSSMFTIDGYISTCSHNAGRSAPDRQYLYVNKRPCEHGKLAKLINEQFHQFNRNQYPMFVLNVTTHTENVDVNVTPDKLQMFIRYEPILMAIIKSSLFNMYSQLYKTVSVHDTSINSPLSSTAIMNSFINKSTTRDSSFSEKKVVDEEKSFSSDGGKKRPITELSPENEERVQSILNKIASNKVI